MGQLRTANKRHKRVVLAAQRRSYLTAAPQTSARQPAQKSG